MRIRENDWHFDVDIAHGHKTGFYLDQRDNRRRFAETVRHFGLQRVLNCYCYTGGFSVAALAGGAAQVLSIDSSAPALARGSNTTNEYAATWPPYCLSRGGTHRMTTATTTRVKATPPPAGVHRTKNHQYYFNGEGPWPGVTTITGVLDKPPLRQLEDEPGRAGRDRAPSG